ncbi:MAG: CapA family protein [Chloroflexi bacterium]|nr:CapA family protein [Chloroflexota bacterium]
MARPIAGSPPSRGARGGGSARGGTPPPTRGGGRPLVGGGPGPISGANLLVLLVSLAGVGLLVGAAVFASGAPGATQGPGSSPGASGAAAASEAPGSSGAVPSGGSASPDAGATPGTTPAGSAELALALVADVDDLRVGLTVAKLAAEIEAGRVAVPCGVSALALAGDPVAVDPAACAKTSDIVTAVRKTKSSLGLLPPALVSPRVKALRVGGADLFGSPSIRAKAYPLVATVDSPPAAWTSFDPAEVRTLISTGDTCPDRGVSHQANTLGKGWDWTLDGGTAKYTGTRMDRRFDGPDGNGWPVVDAVRTGNEGAVRTLISDAEVTLNDFECPMTSKFRQHDTGTIFSIDPKVAPLLAGAGVDVVTLASNHMTDQGVAALKETLALFDENGIERFGAGMNLSEALKPAVLDVRGVRFAFVGFNEIPGSARADASTPGVVYLDEANVRRGIAAARKVADVVIVVPQWGWPEYHANFTARQKQQMKLFWDAGADHVIGHGTHWAGPVSITKDDRGFHFVMGSHGNFLFGQDWSRQTQEAVIVEATFVGSRLAQARLHPFIMLEQAQANLTNPTTDGKYVLTQVWSNSILK